MNTNGNSNGNGNIGDIAARCMLVDLSVRRWGNRKQDRKIGAEAAASHGMGEKVGRYNKWLLIENDKGDPSKLYKAIEQAAWNASIAHRENSLPWKDNGMRIQTAENLFSYSEIMREHRNIFQRAVSEFLANYDELVVQTRDIMNNAAAREGKPTMFDQVNYPSKAQMATKFAFETNIDPIPTGGDFRVNLTSLQVESIKQQIEMRNESAIESAMQSVYEKLYELTQNVLRLDDPKARIMSSLADNISSVCDAAKRLNITRDPKLDQFADRIKNELEFDSSYLKVVPGAREALVDRADAIAKDMASFFNFKMEV